MSAPDTARPIAWVTGARGFIGRRLAISLGERGAVVCGIGHGQLPAQLWRAAGLACWVNSQISAEALGQLAVAHGSPQLVFHLAGGSTVGASMAAPLEDFERTTETTARLLEWLRNHAPRAQLVVASSAAIYGDTQGIAAAESRAPAPVSPYGYHKQMMELLCQEYAQVFGLQIAVLRLFSVYGEGLRKQLLWDCGVKLFEAGDAIELGGTGQELRDWVHVDDAAAMMQCVVQHADAKCPVFNGGSGLGVSVREIVTLLAEALGRPKRIEFSGRSRRGDPASLVADAGRLMRAGHACQVPWTVGIRRYAEWFNLAQKR
jgi:UDP-glucose 4-epimerase